MQLDEVFALDEIARQAVDDARGSKLELEAFGWYKQINPNGNWQALDSLQKFSWFAYAHRMKRDNHN